MQWWVTQMLKSKSSASRREAVLSIGNGEDPRSVQLLTTSLSDRDVDVRIAAVRSLAKIKDESALPPLLSGLKDPEHSVRETTVLGLKAFADKRTIPYLKPLLKDSDASVRSATARTLQQIGWEPGDDRERLRVLVALGEYQQAASLGNIAFDALAEVLRDNSHFTRRFALEALAQLDDERVPSILVDALSDPDAQVRVAAAEELANYQGDEFIAALSQALTDPETLLRAAAASSLSQMGNATCVPHLIEALKDSHWSVRKAAVDALGRMDSPNAVEPLGAVLKDSDHDVREATVIALGRTGDQRAVEWLVGALADASSSVRNSAAAVLNTIDSDWQHSEEAQRAMTALEPLANAKEYWVRHAANSVLAKMRGEDKGPSHENLVEGPQDSSSKRMQVLQTLLQGVEDFDRDIRLATIEALGRLQDSSSAGHLRTLLKDPDEWVQMAAGRALQQVTRQRSQGRATGLQMSLN